MLLTIVYSLSRAQGPVMKGRGGHTIFFLGGGAVQRGISCGQYSIKEDYRKLIAN